MRVLEFLSLNRFVAHQSALFVYHQLKSYSNLIELASGEKFSEELGVFVEKDVYQLEE